MDINKLSTIIALLAALSVASERLVEIIKGLIPFLNKEELEDKAKEGRRKAILHILAVISGIVTAFLARPLLPPEVTDPSNNLGVLALGLLASGSSGFWHDLQTYIAKIKDIKSAQAEKEKK